LGEITLDLRLVIKIPSSKLTINGLVLGLKQSASQIHATILATLLEALEEPEQAAPVQLLAVRLLVSVRPVVGPSKWS
jgi:hypothetical protein